MKDRSEEIVLVHDGVPRNEKAGSQRGGCSESCVGGTASKRNMKKIMED